MHTIKLPTLFSAILLFIAAIQACSNAADSASNFRSSELTVTSLLPESGQNQVATSTEIKIVFNKSLDTAALIENFLELHDSSGLRIAAVIEVGPDQADAGGNAQRFYRRWNGTWLSPVAMTLAENVHELSFVGNAPSPFLAGKKTLPGGASG